MWKVLPKFGLAKLSFLLLCLVITTGLIWKTQGWLGVSEFFFDGGLSVVSSLVLPVLAVFFLITWIFGTYAWRFIWAIPLLDRHLNQKVCPDLNGAWHGTTISTYRGEEIKKEVKMVIKASFFGFDMRLFSVDGYQRSTVIQSEIIKDPRDGSFYLSYIFESVVDQPQKTDDAKFDGAAKLHIRFEENIVKLVGVYWTNRGWQRGEQTAGSICLKKE